MKEYCWLKLATRRANGVYQVDGGWGLEAYNCCRVRDDKEPLRVVREIEGPRLSPRPLRRFLIPTCLA